MEENCPRCGDNNWTYSNGRGCRACKTCKARDAQKRRQELKLEAILALGGQCRCCGELEPKFLTLDHINGGGSSREHEGSRDNLVLIRRLRRLGWPRDEIQILCFQCNCGRAANNGICPHKQQMPPQEDYDQVLGFM